MAGHVRARPTTEVSEIQPKDWGEILEINASARPAVAALDWRELNRLLAFNGHHRVVRRDGTVKGYLLSFSSECEYDGEEFLFLRTLVGKPFIYVDQLAISSEERRNGLGRMLYSALFQEAARRPVRSICCEVNAHPPNPRSFEFHRKLSFVEIGLFHVTDGRKVTLLERRLGI